MWKILAIHIQIILVAVGLVSTLPDDKTGKTVGAKTVNITDYPYMVSVLFNIDGDYFLCGGTILNENYILTAAYCIYDVTAELILVRVGSSFDDRGGFLHRVEFVHIHPCYNNDTRNCDLSILKLSSQISFNSEAQPVKLATADSRIADGLSAVAIGAGYITGNETSTGQFQVVALPIISTQKCNTLNLEDLPENTFCAGNSEEPTFICQGDVGGPIVASGVQIGIISGIHYGCEDSPTKESIVVFTKVSKYRDFIDKTIKS